MASIGFAITKDKASKHLSAELRQAAQAAGIDVHIVDPSEPLDAQDGHPFQAIIHKVRGDAGFEAAVRQYQAAHGGIPVVDDFDAIRPLTRRDTMLHPFADKGLHLRGPPSGGDHDEVVCLAPPQIVCHPGMDLEAAQAAMTDAGMQVPVLAKPMSTVPNDDHATHGNGAHELSVVRSAVGLQQLLERCTAAAEPAVLQPYIAHGDCMYKCFGSPTTHRHPQVYVMGASVVLVRRPTLSLASKAAGQADLEAVDRVSAFPTAHGHSNVHPALDAVNGIASGRDDADLQHANVAAVTHHSASDVLLDGAHEEVGSASSAAVALPDPPPEWVIVSLAQQLQQRLGLQLFNFDLLRPLHSRGPRLYCIDVNYFPGYEKLPGSVPRMLGFMGAVLRGELADGRYGKDSYATCIQLTHQAHPD